MPSQEAKLLGDFLLAPAPLRDFMTLRQFTDIFPRSHRENPAVQDLYRELHRLREAEIEIVRNDVTKEVRRSKQLRQAYAQERRQEDDARVAGTDPVALEMEMEVSLPIASAQAGGNARQAFRSWSQDTTQPPDSPRQYRGCLPNSRSSDRRDGGREPASFS